MSMRAELQGAARRYMKAAQPAVPPAVPWEGEVMLLLVVRAFCLGGGRDAQEGDKLRAPGDLDPRAAELKILQGFLRKLPPPAPAKEKPKTGATKAAAANIKRVISQDPEPVTRAGGRESRGEGKDSN